MIVVNLNNILIDKLYYLSKSRLKLIEAQA